MMDDYEENVEEEEEREPDQEGRQLAHKDLSWKDDSICASMGLLRRGQLLK